MNITMISEKKTEYSIIVPANCSVVEQTAAEELKQYLKKALDVDLLICKEGEASGKAFYVGNTDYAKAAGVLGKSKENWIIKMVDANLVLTGGETNVDRGIPYSVYHFLEDVIGVRWWTRFEEDVPELCELSLADDFYKEGTPAFHFRKILSHKDIPDFFFEARNRGNIVMIDDNLPGDFRSEQLATLGGAMHMGRPNHVHSLGLYFPAKDYFEEHPDWFAWSDFEQKRVTYGHYCLTNEEYIQAMIDKLLGFVREDQKLWREQGIEPPVFYSVSFPDTANGFCQCEKCKAMVAKKGPSGYAIDFVNKLARAVAKEFPDVKLETLVYSVYLDKPLDDTLPEKNLIIRLAQVFVDLIHGVHERGNAWYLQLLKDWSEICKKSGSDLYIWDYMYQLFFDIPGPVARRAADTWRAFAEYGVKGVFVENQCYSADFWELSLYVLLHLNEDPYADVDALIEDFMTRFYGPAAPYVKAYYDELDRAATENPYSIFCVIESAHFNYLDVGVFKKGMPLLEKALEAVKGNAVLEPRVRYLRTLLAGSLLLKYRDLKRRAAELGESFDFDVEAVRKMAVDGYKEMLNRPKPRPDLDDRFKRHAKYFEDLSLEDEVAELPAELSHINPEDTYQFFFKNTCRHLSLNALYGFSVVEDPEAATGVTGKFCKDDTTVDYEIVCLATCPKDAVGAKGISIAIEQDAKILSSIELFKEDIVPDKFHLYKVGSVSGIRASGDTRVDMFGNNFEWLSLTGISVLFPMDACDVYLSMKFTGEMYGGSKDDQEAVYLDRAIVVRTKR
ncbi:MAG: DUF4838 domain-containing protein [Ruminococcaceae bacterium]|nr:DUF4838 domain-containing protein [Oscillospiraceae bacterium]